MSEPIKSKNDHGGPYTACTNGMGPWWVEDKTGWNTLRFEEKPGAIFTNEATAKEVAEAWNGQQ